MKVGDLIKWVDYRPVKPVTKVGLFIRTEKIRVDAATGDWGDWVVLWDGKEVKWTSWQCEVLNE